jgi:hypothetical protein
MPEPLKALKHLDSSVLYVLPFLVQYCISEHVPDDVWTMYRTLLALI